MHGKKWFRYFWFIYLDTTTIDYCIDLFLAIYKIMLGYDRIIESGLM